MKKVWILEKFETTEDIENTLVELMEDQLKCKDNQTSVDTLEQIIQRVCKQIEETPEGYWFGLAGRTIYRQFCQEAVDTMRRNKGKKFRVIEAEIEDNADTWLGYKFVKENDGVMRYLYATM